MMCGMPSKTQPVITCRSKTFSLSHRYYIFKYYYSDSGDSQLFNTLEAAISQGLPQETVEWKRSYGRQPRAVTLSASFQPFKIENDAREQTKYLRKLSESQVLHTYWIECPVSAHQCVNSISCTKFSNCTGCRYLQSQCSRKHSNLVHSHQTSRMF